MYIQKLEKINQQFKQVNSLTSQNLEELLDNLNTEMDEVISILINISLFMEKNSNCLS